MSREVQNGGHAVYKIGVGETVVGAARFAGALTAAVAGELAKRTLIRVLDGAEVVLPRAVQEVEDNAKAIKSAAVSGRNQGQDAFKAIAAGVKRGLRGAAH